MQWMYASAKGSRAMNVLVLWGTQAGQPDPTYTMKSAKAVRPLTP